jgi:uncharacterized protein (TIRG00374 family)
LETNRKHREGAGPAPAPAAAREDAPRWRAWTAQVALVTVAAVLLYVGLASWSDLGQVLAVLRTFPGASGLRVAALVGAGLALRAARWHVYTRALGLVLPPRANALAFVAGFAFTATPGKAGEVVKSLLLKRRFGTPIAKTAGTLVVERLTDLLAVLLLAVVGLRGELGQKWVVAASAAALVAAVSFLASERLQDRVLLVAGRVPGLGRVTRALPALLGSSRSLMTPRRLAAGLALAVAAWSCEALALDVILGALGAPVPRAGAFFAFAAASLLGVLSMLPGGLGGFEASMVLILDQLGVSSATAVAATLLFRVGTLWAVSVLGLVALGVWVAAFGTAARPGGSR